jgi:3-deoxy-D-manno-octulosonate 8-phosphate phosphatase (KDO 8-P phosphatase)
MNDLKEKAKKIKMLVFDVDGVLTDGGIILGNNKIELKIFNSLDGEGIKIANQNGFITGIVTGRESELVSVRASELKITEVIQKEKNKIAGINKLIEKYKVSYEEIAYFGDDLPDISAMVKVGFPVAVANACEEIKKVACYVTEKKGGQGAVREGIELLLKLQNKYEEIVKKYY